MPKPEIPIITNEPVSRSCSRIIPVLILALLTLLLLNLGKEPFLPHPFNRIKLPKPKLTNASTIHIKSANNAIIRDIAIISNDANASIYKLTSNKLPPVSIKSIVIDSPNLGNSIIEIKDGKGLTIWTNTKPVNRINDAYVITFEESIYPNQQQVLSNELSIQGQEHYLFYYNKK